MLSLYQTELLWSGATSECVLALQSDSVFCTWDTNKSEGVEALQVSNRRQSSISHKTGLRAENKS